MNLTNVFGWSALRVPDSRFAARNIQPLKKETVDKIKAISIKDINVFVNHHVKYTFDRYDEWQNPQYTYDTKTGDCEDYVLLKRAILLQKGYKEENIVILLVRDLILRLSHALLLIYSKGEWWVLDNQHDQVLSINKTKDYMPIIAYNNNNAWTFGKKV